MGLYRQKNSKVWWMTITQNKERRRISTGTTDKQKAKEIYAKVTTQLVENKWYGTDETKLRTLYELIDRYVKERSSNKEPKSRQRDLDCFKHIKAYLGDCSLSAVTPAKISSYKQSRLEVVGPATVVKELGALKHAFNLAIREWEWCRDNPVAKVSMPPLPPGRTRFLTEDEFNRVLGNAEGWFKPVILVAALTGMREGNLISLRWDQVDLEKRVIILTKTKNKTPIAIPINDPLLAVFRGLKEQEAKNKVVSIKGIVLQRDGRPLNPMLLGRALKRACRLSEIEDFRFHDLRHTFASHLVQKGTSLYVVSKLLGHKDLRMTQRYAHLSHEQFADAVELLNGLGQKSHSLVIVGEKEKELQAVAP